MVSNLSALQYLEAGNSSQVLNCGYGRGYSVREVAQCVQKLSNNNFVLVEAGRRLGDPAYVTASVEKIHGTLNWEPRYAELEESVRSALSWEKTLR